MAGIRNRLRAVSAKPAERPHKKTSLLQRLRLRGEEYRSNVYALIGKEGVVVEDIRPGERWGLVKVEKEDWSAVSRGNEVIPRGSPVKVLDIEGVKLIVEPL